MRTGARSRCAGTASAASQSTYGTETFLPKDILNIETLAGIIRPEKAGDMVKVDMGEPIFDPEKIPVDIPPLNSPLGKGGVGGTSDPSISTLSAGYRLSPSDRG